MSAKRKAKELTVSRSHQLTKNMLRLTLQGDDLQEFPDDAEGAYFKLTFAGSDADRPIMRTYTVAKFRREQREIDVDFMLHGKDDIHSEGVAAPWARRAKVGDKMSIFGPGPATFIHPQADWYLLAADMTALPAMVANLDRLPEDAKGYIVVEVLSAEDQQELGEPTHMQVLWVINSDAGSDASPLFNTITNLQWLDGQASVWTACEFKTMKKIRQYYRDEHSLQKPHLYVSSYWKQGLKEEEHKVAKRDDAQ